MNFYNLLNNDDFDIEEASTEQCLISQDSLDLNYITLDCNHKFNFLPLYFEIKKQKTIKNHFETTNLKLNEIKCPYCRTITNRLIPFYKYYNVKQIRGVNSPPNLCIFKNECEYISKKTNKKCTNYACITKCGIFCNNHMKYNFQDEIIIESLDKNQQQFYKKRLVKNLKELLKQNKCKVGGTKNELVTRILIEKSKNMDWIEII